MKKVVLLPLDERPCNYNFPYKLFNNTAITVVRPDMSIMGDKKKPGNLTALKDFLIKETKDAYGLVVSLDTLLYGGIVPSRLHYFSTQELKERLSVLKLLKENNPELKIYALHLVMRCPQYSISDEEPDYYAECGYEIFKYGFIKDKMELKIATEDEVKYFNNMKFNMKYLEDFLARRRVNVALNLESLDYVKENVIDFLIIPQDDSAEYGWTAADQKVIRKKIEEDKLQLRAYMYPGADEVEHNLLSKMVCELNGKRPLVYIKYPVITAGSTVPVLEDRFLDTTVKYQVLAAGGLIATSLSEADIVLFVNAPADVMLWAPHQMETKGPGMTTQRNMVEFIEFCDYVVNVAKKPAIMADVAYGNGSDLELISLLEQKGLTMKLAAYAGWNTSSNTLGTCIAQGFLFWMYGNTQVHKDFMALRYVEDAGYCAVVRRLVDEKYLKDLNYDYFNVEEQRGKVAAIVKKELQKFMSENIPSIAGNIVYNDVYMPWRRMFEVGLDVSYKDKETGCKKCGCK